MKVAKFGGSSLASADQVRKVYEIIADDPDRKFVVVSAPGKRNKQDTKVTDLLIAAANARPLKSALTSIRPNSVPRRARAHCRAAASSAPRVASYAA